MIIFKFYSPKKNQPLLMHSLESNILATPKSANFTGAEFSLLASRMLCGCKSYITFKYYPTYSDLNQRLYRVSPKKTEPA